MTPVCPNCGSVTVERHGRLAACMSPYCTDNGVTKPVKVFKLGIAGVSRPYDSRRVLLGGGGAHIRPVFYDDAA